VSGSYFPYGLVVPVPLAVSIYRTLDSLLAGYELMDHEAWAIERFKFHVEQISEAQGGAIGKPRTGFVPPAQARMGSDDSHGHCLRCGHQSDD